MYTILENARIVISLLKKHNIRYIVLSPGGSNIPIVQGVQHDPFFKCYSVVDERSAMYFAIGLYLQTGEIIATSCTSAQATRNYIPGLTEAYYKRAPILAITMSKHPRYLRQDYMQCPIQTSLPVDSVKKSFSLPRISNEHDRAQCIRTANDAILELTHHGKGPVQLNIEEIDSETWAFDYSIEKLPDVRSIHRYNYWDSLNPNEMKGKRIMLLIGEHRPFSDEEILAIESFTKSHNVFVYSDHTSNYSGQYALNANPVVSTTSQSLFIEKYAPEILITIGGLTGDYAIFKPLFKTPEGYFEHWRVDIDGNVVDTYGKLTRIYEMQPSEFFIKMTSEEESEHSYYATWKLGLDSIDYNIDIPLSNLYAAIRLCRKIPAGSIMNYAILNSLRVWGYVQIGKSVKTFSNLAAFGIDGCMSTAFGESVETNDLTFLITGDLAFYYDMNALGIRHLKNNIRVLLCNNNGGMEFKFGSLFEKTDVSTYIAADGHFKNCKGWAETNGFEYIPIHNKEQFDASVDRFVGQSDKPILMELFTTPENERKANGTFLEKNMKSTKKETLNKSIKSAIKKSISEKSISRIKKIIN